MTILETLARAVWRKRQEIHGRYPDCGPFDQQPEMIKDWVRAEVGACLLAARNNVSWEMDRAGHLEMAEQIIRQERFPATIFRAMIDVALSQSQTPSE